MFSFKFQLVSLPRSVSSGKWDSRLKHGFESFTEGWFAEEQKGSDDQRAARLVKRHWAVGSEPPPSTNNTRVIPAFYLILYIFYVVSPAQARALRILSASVD